MFTYGFYVGNRYIVSVLSRNLILILLYKIQFLIFFLWLLLSFTDIHFPSFNINGILSGKTQQHGSNRITIENEDELQHHKGFLILNISVKQNSLASNKWTIRLEFWCKNNRIANHFKINNSEYYRLQFEISFLLCLQYIRKLSINLIGAITFPSTWLTQELCSTPSC